MAMAPVGAKILSTRSEQRQALKITDLILKRRPPTTTPVFETYWRFAAERQATYFRRLRGEPGPWTTDPIIRAHRFTNAYRAADRVSQYLIRHVIYGERATSDLDDLAFRVLLFKLFNKVETWQLLAQHLGDLTWVSYDYGAYDQVLTRAIEGGRRIYSAAYIMPACSATSAGDGRKHRSHLRLIEHLMTDGFPCRLAGSKGMAAAFELLRNYPMFGNFLAYQFAIDLNYGPLTKFGEDEFVIPGPGARDGLRKVFSDPGDFDETDLIRWVADRQEREFERLGLTFRTLWGRRLQLIDCQNLFCEVDKYARVRHPELAGLSGRTRIKQKFTPRSAAEVPWFPPKWGLNDQIRELTTTGSQDVAAVSPASSVR